MLDLLIVAAFVLYSIGSGLRAPGRLALVPVWWRVLARSGVAVDRQRQPADVEVR